MHHAISFFLRVAYAAAFGFILLCHTEAIIHYIPQLLGGLLMLEAIAQLIELFALKLKTNVHYGFFFAPLAVLLYALFLIFFCKMEIDINNFLAQFSTLVKLKIELKVGGACFMLFVISELVISGYFFKPLYCPAKFAEEKRIKNEAAKLVEEQNKTQEKAQTKENENIQCADPEDFSSESSGLE